MKKLNILFNDLRFVIGLFFSIVAFLLGIAGFLNPVKDPDSWNLNWLAAGYTGLFSVLMLSFSLIAYRKTLLSQELLDRQKAK